MNFNTKIAAAVAAVLGLGAAGAASAFPTQTQAQAAVTAGNVLYISGSSAAKNGILGALENDMCAGSSNALIFSSTGDTNFFAVACTPASTTGITGANGSTVFTVFYRDEGGSVTGALPLVSGSAIQQLDLTQTASCATNVCTIAVGGSSAANGTQDSFTGTTPHQSGLGVTDVEPGALIGDNYPTAYNTAVYGKASALQLGNLSTTPVFQQVFGLFVNKTGLNTPICLTTDEVQGLLSGGVTDWSKVEDCATHAKVANASQPVTVVNREAGSGSRTATSIFWLNDECDKSNSGVLEDQATDYFSTGNVLAAANTTNGGITYASIDNIGASANLVTPSINGVAPTNLAAAQGQYPWWVESDLVSPNYTISGVASTIAAFLESDLQNANTAPHTAQINMIPDTGTGTAPAIPASSTANTCSNSACSVSTSTAIYVNPFTKGNVSCAIPVSFL